MTLQSVHAGDIVEVDRKGRRFYAEVEEKTSGNVHGPGRVLSIRPLDTRITYRTATSREVVQHWRKSRRCT